MTTLLEQLHNGHSIGKAYNSFNSNTQITLLYCRDCGGDFHGCYCDDVENCFNCEQIEDIHLV